MSPSNYQVLYSCLSIRYNVYSARSFSWWAAKSLAAFCCCIGVIMIFFHLFFKQIVHGNLLLHNAGVDSFCNSISRNHRLNYRIFGFCFCFE